MYTCQVPFKGPALIFSLWICCSHTLPASYASRQSLILHPLISLPCPFIRLLPRSTSPTEPVHSSSPSISPSSFIREQSAPSARLPDTPLHREMDGERRRDKLRQEDWMKENNVIWNRTKRQKDEGGAQTQGGIKQERQILSFEQY